MEHKEKSSTSDEMLADELSHRLQVGGRVLSKTMLPIQIDCKSLGSFFYLGVAFT